LCRTCSMSVRNSSVAPTPFFSSQRSSISWPATKKARSLGRVTAHINERHNRHAGEKTGFFGFFECVEDQAAASALMAAAEDDLRARGVKVIRGPLISRPMRNAGSWSRIRSAAILYDALHQALLPDLMTRLGYSRAKDLLAYEYEYQGNIPDYLVRLSRRIRDRKQIVIRSIDHETLCGRRRNHIQGLQ